MTDAVTAGQGISSQERIGERLGVLPVERDDRRWRFSAAGRAPLGVVRPQCAADVSSAVQDAAKNGFAVIPCGNATGLEIGHPPKRYDVALCSRSMNHIVAHDAGDMTVVVESGATLSEVNGALGAAGQWLPFDPARAEDVTVGGLIAADRSGPMRLAYGKVRDLLIGIKVVTADGQLLKGGGRVVKNVAGYDVPKLFAGSFGTLGVIVEATFKVLPRPSCQELYLWHTASLAEAIERGLGLLRTGLRPMILEAVNVSAAETIGIAGQAALLVGLGGSEAQLAGQVEALRVESAAQASSFPADRSAAVRRALSDFGAPASEEALVARISTLPASLAALLQRVEAEATARQVLVEISAHAGNGVAWCQVFEATDPKGPGLFAEWLRVATREVGGWVVFEAIPEAWRGKIDPWGFSESSVPLMSRVKDALDPQHLFSPGRFVGGI